MKKIEWELLLDLLTNDGWTSNAIEHIYNALEHYENCGTLYFEDKQPYPDQP